jgi:hypothetical protein
MFDSFRQRPLTWLFAVAYATLMAAALVGEEESVWSGFLLVVGIYIVAASAALSRRHRLARAAIWLVGAAAAMALISSYDGLDGETMALVAAMAVAPLITAGATRAALRLGAAPQAPAASARWRISIIEILGWMIVVAIASAGLRFAEFRVLKDSYQNSLWIHGAIVGVIAGLFLTPERRIDRIATVLSTAVVIGALFVLPRVIDDWYSEREFLVPMYAVFGLWILVLRLDEAAATKPAPFTIVPQPANASQDEG